MGLFYVFLMTHCGEGKNFSSVLPGPVPGALEIKLTKDRLTREIQSFLAHVVETSDEYSKGSWNLGLIWYLNNEFVEK